MAITIVSDSTTEISQEEAKQLGIEIVPLRSIFGEEVYLDGIDMSPEEFYQKLEEAEELPTTSQPTPHDFEQVFCRELEAGNQIIVITIAENLSGTLQSASIAREKVGDGDIHIIDSESATLALRLLVDRALELRDSGVPAAEIAQTLEAEKKSIRLFAAIDTLEYLQKGGRLSKTSALAGTLLKVKPLISLQEGKIEVVSKCRGMQKAYEELFILAEEAGGIDLDKPFAIGYTGNRERLIQFEQVCDQHSNGHTPHISSIGSVIGTHAGPGAVAMAFFSKGE